MVPKPQQHAASRPPTRDSGTVTEETWVGVQEATASHEVEKGQLLHALAVARISQEDAHEREMQALYAEVGKSGKGG